MRQFCIGLVIAFSCAPAFASGHGPVFGFATPVNSQGETSFDFGAFARNARSGSQTELRTMLGYGVTPHVQVSLVLPAVPQPLRSAADGDTGAMTAVPAERAETT